MSGGGVLVVVWVFEGERSKGDRGKGEVECG